MKWLPYILILPFLAQSLLMLVDEFYYHHKRSLPLWERVGHPLDTLSVLTCFVLVLVAPITATTLFIYAFATLFSMLLVTKDEWVHQAHCEAGEHWVHALLFVLHPLMLASAFSAWPFVGVGGHSPLAGIITQHLDTFAGSLVLGYAELGVEHFTPLVFFLKIHTLLTGCFFLYQVSYWLIFKHKELRLLQ